MAEQFEIALFHRFHFERENQPYPDESALLDDWMALVSGYLCLGCAIQRESAGPGGAVGLAGASFGPVETLRYLSAFPQAGFETPEEVILLFTRAERMIAQRLALTLEGGQNFRLCRVARTFALDDFALFCLVCSLCAGLDRGFESAFALLHGQDALAHPTVGVLRSLYGLIHPAPGVPSFCDPGALSALLFVPQQPATLALWPVALHPHLTAYLCGCEYRGRFQPDSIDRTDKPLFCDGQYRAAEALTARLNEGGQSCLGILCGPRGSGKKLTVRRLAGRLGRRLLLIPAEELPDGEPATSDLLRYVLLDGCLICLDGADLDSAEQRARLERLLRALAPHRAGVFLLTERLRRNFCPDGYLCRRIDYPLPDQGQAVRLWTQFAADYPAAPELDWRAISGRFSLSPGQMKGALRDAALEAAGGPIDGVTLRGAILRANTSRLSELADRIDLFYTWDDLVLDDTSKGMLREVCNRIKYKFQVEEQWGFRSKSAYGNGISVLLYGPPGTGKTMSAQVLAGELWLPLYRINLAQIISKYIGETAKNLDAIFNEARNSNVILFFDEADALFAKRTDVQNANDRYSNSETSYLLQKIEEFSGISILATNLANNFDDAFRRRINYMINIHMPSEAQRLQLWRSAFPQDAPLDSEIDFEMLAGSLEISGSVIKSAALQAAYFAADEGCAIGMRQIVRAVRIELSKAGKPEPRYFQHYTG